MFAAAITAYDGNPYPIEDPEIGLIKLIYKSWDVAADDSSLNFVEIPTRLCTKEDFTFSGQENSNSLFYPIKETSEADLNSLY